LTITGANFHQPETKHTKSKPSKKETPPGNSSTQVRAMRRR